MAGEFKIIEEPRKQRAMDPKKFAMWLFIGSVLMLFASLTSAYIVREAEGNWVYFDLPVQFTISTIVIALSSVTMHWAYLSAKKDDLSIVKLMVSITFGLGVIFLVLQVLGWGEMVANQIHLVGNPSGSFVYILTLVHGLHIVSALVFLAIVLIAAYRFKIHSKNLNQLEMCITYWHFLGGLWLYLFVFILLYR